MNEKLSALYDQVAAEFKLELESDAAALREEGQPDMFGADLFLSMLDANCEFDFINEIRMRLVALFGLERRFE